MVSGADERFHSTGILAHRGHKCTGSVKGMTPGVHPGVKMPFKSRSPVSHG